MSGGTAYVFDRSGAFARRCNREMVDLESLTNLDDLSLVRDLIERHARLTGSVVGARILDDWTSSVKVFVKIMPREYRKALAVAQAFRPASDVAQAFRPASEPDAPELLQVANG
jgi:glutamate synthase (ferredoxin)